MGIHLKVGDVFEVVFDQNKRYFQYIGNDLSQLNMDVIRVFKTSYPADENPKIEDIVNNQIDFYAQVTDVNYGIEDGLYTKFGNSSEVGKIDDIYFRKPNSLMTSPECEMWYVWPMNGERKLISYKNVLLKKTNPGIGMPPKDVIHRMKLGYYPFVYPKYPGEK